MNSGGGFFMDDGDRGVTASSSKRNTANSRPHVFCTVAELLSATREGEGFISKSGIPLNNVVLVGVVRQAQDRNSRIEYLVDDLTSSQILVNHFSDATLAMQAEKVFGDVQPRAHGEGTYVRVTGILKPASKDSTQGATFVMAFSVKSITSFNEVSRHALEVMRAHLKLKQARLTKENVTSDAVPYNHGGAGQQQWSSGNDSSSGITALQNRIMSLLRQLPQGDPNGLSLTDLRNSLGRSTVTDAQIRTAMEQLANEGHVFSTTDEDHFRCL